MIYVGPYAVANGTKNLERIEVERVCPNKKCVKYEKKTNDKFCSQCGTTIINVDVPKVDKFDAQDLMNERREFIDRLTCPGEMSHILMSNKRIPGGIEIDADSGSEIHEFKDTEIISKQIAWFEKEFANEIAYLRENLKKVEIKWGIINYWS